MYKRLIVAFLILADGLLSAFTYPCRMQQQKKCFFLSFL